ncbi:Putative major facilitator superfamily, MFS transporter superfamily [Septoria linicola]|uniref:Major facilitator superfamily, MFS transporter superfamily n=1 Tax=Septoria linicola TaxID=215465 RepID=A0A9Q9EEV9_9PEZI|nr:Putative major facilitator superfamily, MFS transporter superfamily [Septoria linicola]
MPRLFSSLTATRLQAATYLLGIALFSISFLVFLNSSISFVVTEVIGQTERVGDAVGTLGFADELLALIACPLWGLISDRVGVRAVAVTGYCIVAFSLACLVQSTNVYPELLLGRLCFSLGGAACSTMVTAVLPSMVMAQKSGEDEETAAHTSHVARPQEEDIIRANSASHAPSPSINSELTITPASFASSGSRGRGPIKNASEDSENIDSNGRTAHTSQLAGLVGFFTGAGALVALAIFLPLPVHFQNSGLDRAESVQASFYVVAFVALAVAVAIFFGLRNLPGEEKKTIKALFRPPYDEATTVGPDGRPHIILSPAPSYFVLAKQALKLGFTDSAIGLGYLGGFVARASSVAISLFIPLFVNAYFVRSGLCTSNPDNLTDIKQNCERAYKLAAALTGIGELAALLCAPIFGWLGGRAATTNSEWPLLAASVIGILGYVSFGLLKNPDAFHGDGGQWAFLSVILTGISQIGAIVCSLALLGRGSGQTSTSTAHRARTTSSTQRERQDHEEGAPLLESLSQDRIMPQLDRSRLSGSIAGMYSFAGGAGILILTKAGGALFDSWHTGAPFFLMAIFNGILLAAIVLVRAGSAVIYQSKPKVSGS